VKLRQRLAGIDVHLDDVQAGAEACSRAADTLIADTAKFDGPLEGPLLRAVTRHIQELQACARDQWTALGELRNSVAQLRDELNIAKRAVIRPPSPTAIDRQP
jgi:nucleotide-binding universal stress UspA family protein